VSDARATLAVALAARRSLATGAPVEVTAPPFHQPSPEAAAGARASNSES
jgi:hypothetical protein